MGRANDSHPGPLPTTIQLVILPMIQLRFSKSFEYSVSKQWVTIEPSIWLFGYRVFHVEDPIWSQRPNQLMLYFSYF